eukprot:CAMPEP_0169087280 /NCGR_PEP_ID=MMETSP1015-20121227/14147_1 /TAXON_ID=342587 /ORGANISM="Karlodinium micrum, Strain CCMP2283" /LENGTH=430 /DNA_ID=CAMNT_0009147499 /DNA_START=83 /DNA_END=1375 /DNA_ORIENTATION=-
MPRSILLFAVLFTVSHRHNAEHALEDKSSHQDLGLRQSESKSSAWAHAQLQTNREDPKESSDEDDGSSNEDEDPKTKKKVLEKDATGSPTSKEMKKIDKAIRKTQKIYEWPLFARLLLVGAILALPILIIAVCIRTAPAAEDLATNVYVKTAIHCGFSFSIGWINCIMLLRYKVFATMMVGNTILMGVAFVCNGGFSTATEKEYWYWQGPQVKALCPAQFEDAGYYAAMIALFLLGTFIQGLFYKSCGLSSRAFAPVCALVIIIVEMLEYFGVIHDSKLDVYMLSPVFGIIVSISANCGVGGVPWAATGNMTSAGFNFASAFVGALTNKFTGQKSETINGEIQKVFVNLCLWIAFVSGICMGTFFHSNRTVIFNALYMQGLLYFNGMVFQPAERRPLLPSNQKEYAQTDDGCVFRPTPMPRTVSAQAFIG